MELNTIVSNYTDFLYFFKKSFPDNIFHNSNVYHRDIQYTLTRYIQKKESKTLPISKSEELTIGLESALEKNGVFKKINNQAWMLNYPDFIKPKVEKKS